MPFTYTAVEKHKTLNNIYTPAYVAEWLHTLTKHLRPGVVFDPAVGGGALLKPWQRNSVCIGMDIEPQVANGYTHLQADFLYAAPIQVPDLVIANPPWCCAPGGKSYPYLFLRRIVHLYGPEIPIIFLCPMGLRLNLKNRSARRQWFLGAGTPEITSVIAAPLDMYPNTLFHSEILFFNIKRCRPHYFVPNPPVERVRFH